MDYIVAEMIANLNKEIFNQCMCIKEAFWRRLHNSTIFGGSVVMLWALYWSVALTWGAL